MIYRVHTRSEYISRIKYFAISNKIYDMKTTLILNHDHKHLPSAKNILGIISTVELLIDTDLDSHDEQLSVKLTLK